MARCCGPPSHPPIVLLTLFCQFLTLQEHCTLCSTPTGTTEHNIPCNAPVSSTELHRDIPPDTVLTHVCSTGARGVNAGIVSAHHPVCCTYSLVRCSVVLKLHPFSLQTHTSEQRVLSSRQTKTPTQKRATKNTHLLT